MDTIITGNKQIVDLDDPSIRKFKKKISQDYWMLKIHKWAYGRTPNFKGYCPLFWSTWALLPLSPFIAIGKLGEFGIDTAVNVTRIGLGAFKSTEPDKVKEIIYRKPADSQIIILAEFMESNNIDNLQEYYNKKHDNWGIWSSFGDDITENYGYDKQHVNMTSIIGWVKQNPNWKDFYKLAIINVKNLKNKQLAAKQRKEQLAIYTNKITNFCGILVKPTLWLSAVGTSYYLIKLVIYLFHLIVWSAVGIGALKLAGILMVVLLATLIISFVCKIVGTLIKQLSSIKLPEKEKSESSFFNRLCVGIGEGISFIYDTGRLLYTKECPLIEYSDTTSSIVKNKIEKLD